MTDFDPRDRFDIPDDREPEHHIPEAVCDVQTPVWAHYPFHCPECGRYGTEEDGCEMGGECPDEDCDGTIVANGEEG